MPVTFSSKKSAEAFDLIDHMLRRGEKVKAIEKADETLLEDFDVTRDELREIRRALQMSVAHRQNLLSSTNSMARQEVLIAVAGTQQKVS
jgi:hypothetical protein